MSFPSAPPPPTVGQIEYYCAFVDMDGVGFGNILHTIVNWHTNDTRYWYQLNPMEKTQCLQ